MAFDPRFPIADPRLAGPAVAARSPGMRVAPTLNLLMEYQRGNLNRAAEKLALIDRMDANQQQQLGTKFDDMQGSLIGRMIGRGFMNSSGIGSTNATVGRERGYAFTNLKDKMDMARLNAHDGLESARFQLDRTGAAAGSRKVTSRVGRGQLHLSNAPFVVNPNLDSEISRIANAPMSGVGGAVAAPYARGNNMAAIPRMVANPGRAWQYNPLSRTYF